MGEVTHLRDRRRAGMLRAAALVLGCVLFLSGLVGAVESYLHPGLHGAASVLVGGVGLSLAVSALSAPRPETAARLWRDFAVVGAALAIGALLESLHHFDVLVSPLYHLGLAAAVGVVAAWLGTVNHGESVEEQAVLRRLRGVGIALVVSAGLRFFAVSAEQGHGAAASASMLLIALAGLLLVRLTFATPRSSWARL